MASITITCCLLGGKEADLHVLGELHKRDNVHIAFVYDPDPSAVALEIAEILGILPLSDLRDMESHEKIEYAVVSEPRGRFEDELHIIAASGAKIISQTEALEVLCGREPAPAPPAPAEGETYSIDDALAAFERLFDREQLLKFLLDVAVQATRASAGSIMMYSAESNDLYIAYATGLSERVIRKTRQKIGEGIAGTVAKDRRGTLIQDVQDNRLYAAERDRVDIRSAVSVPLEQSGELLGVLNVSSDSDGEPLGEDDLATLERLSGRIARLVHESTHLQEIQVRRREMNLRQSMGQLSEQTLSPAAKFSLIANLLSDLVGADTVEIFIGTHEGDWLVLGGSNRRVSNQPDMIRCGNGALSRAFLERRTVVLTENVDDGSEANASSFIFVPLYLTSALGVLAMEFASPSRVDEFVVIKDSVTLELARFIASEKRERKLRRELAALGKVSEAAPILLTCRTLDDLCDYVSRLVADALECDRVSVRIQTPGEGNGKLARFEGGTSRSQAWAEEDEERFLKLKKKQKPFSLAFLDFAPDAVDSARAYHSLMAVPIHIDDAFSGGIIAYDKRPAHALEDATFSPLDSTVIDQIIALAVPVARALSGTGAAQDRVGKPSYENVIQGNLVRLKKVIEAEMARADRYHHAFALIILRIKPLDLLFEKEHSVALALIEEINTGIQTRTRKTDYGTWMRRDTFAMLSLEGTRRVKFLISRLMLYLLKDFSAAGLGAIDPSDVLIGHAIYPGSSRTPESMLQEVESILQPRGEE